MSGNADDDYAAKTDAQKEWSDWSAHGYRKLYQPRSMLWFGGILALVLVVVLVAVFWLAANDRLP